MSLLPILIYGDPRLHRVARPVAVDDRIRKLAADMVETMYAAPGRGLAAPQVGEDLRMFVMDCHWKDGADRNPTVVINPLILSVSEETKVHEEGCLSIPDVPVEVARPAEVVLQWQDLDGQVHQKRFGGFEAVCVQHEYDHLDGILNVDRIPNDQRAAIADRLAGLAA